MSHASDFLFEMFQPATPAPTPTLTRAEAWAAYDAAAARRSAALDALIALNEIVTTPLSPERQAWLDASADAHAAFEAWAALATEGKPTWEDC